MSGSEPAVPVARNSGAGALFVAAGIFLSRIAGFVRQKAFAHYLGSSDAADAFTLALRAPNFLQNLFGEGVLSASFIPVYARLVDRDEKEARRVAGAIASLLFLAMSVLVLAGIALAPALVSVFAAGFDAAKQAETVRLVRVLFPGTGLLVMSAWCLGVLNSHRRFFLSYVAPVLWNGAIIAALLLAPAGDEYGIALAAAWGAVLGSALQLGVQLPAVLTLLRGLSPGLGRGSEHVRTVIASFVPVVMGRGVVQISGWADSIIASFLASGSVAVLGYAQMLYQLPVSLFGMSVSAAELAEMSRSGGDDAAALRARLLPASRRIAFFVVPSAFAFVAIGLEIIGVVYRGGEFGRESALVTWATLAAFGVGLVAATLGRLQSSTLYALRAPQVPFRIAIARVAVGIALGLLFAFEGPPLLGVEPRWAVAGLALASAFAAWLEFLLLRAAVARRIGRVRIPAGFLARVIGSAAIASAAGAGARAVLPAMHPALAGLAVCVVFGLVYLASTAALRVEESASIVAKVRRRLLRR